jgi:hypothetical protein
MLYPEKIESATVFAPTIVATSALDFQPALPHVVRSGEVALATA